MGENGPMNDNTNAVDKPVDEDSQSNLYTRRDVLRMAGITGAGLVMASCQPLPAAQPPSSGVEEITEAGEAPASITTGTPITVAVLGTQVREGYQRAAELFAEEFPEIKVELTAIQGDSWDDYFTKILTQVAAGNAPDVTLIATEGTQVFAGQGIGAPLDDLVKRDADQMGEFFADVHPALIEAMMYEGNLYQLPFSFNAANMFYNTALLEEAGFGRPADDWTVEEFHEIAQTITMKEGDQTTVFGYGWPNRLWGGWLPWIFVNGSNLLVEERAPGGDWLWSEFYADEPAAKERGGGWRYPAVMANDPANVEALEFVMQLTREGTAPSVEQANSVSLNPFFVNGSLGMTVAGMFYVYYLNNNGMAADAYDVQYWPRWKSQRHQFGAAGFAVLESATDKDAAWEWVKHFTSKEVMESNLVDSSSTPVRRSLVTKDLFAEAGPEHWEVFYGTLDNFPDTAPIPAPPEAQEMTNIFVKHTGRAMAFEATAQEALDDMQQEIEDLFARTRS